MTLQLYELGGRNDCRYSLFSWRARLALAHKGLPVDYRPVRISDKTAIAFSQQGKVPILVDGNRTVPDSWDIAVYLEEQYNDRPSLFGGAVGQGLAKFINTWVDRQVVPVVARLVACDVIDLLEPDDAAFLRTAMERGLRMSLEQMRAERDEGVKAFRRILDPARATLRAQPYLSGVAPAYADYILFSPLQWGRITSSFVLLNSDDKVMRDWCERMLDLFDGFPRREPARVA